MLLDKAQLRVLKVGTASYPGKEIMGESSSALGMVQCLSGGSETGKFLIGNFPVLLDFHGNKTEKRRQFPLVCLKETFQGVFLSGWCKAVVIPEF